MEILQKNIGLMREYRIRLMAVIQDLAQLYTTYGHDGAKAFINTKIRVAFAQNDIESAKLISSWLGDKTITQYTRNRRGLSWNSELASDGESLSYVRRELMLASEIMQLPKDKAIVAAEGSAPLKMKKISTRMLAN